MKGRSFFVLMTKNYSYNLWKSKLIFIFLQELELQNLKCSKI